MSLTGLTGHRRSTTSEPEKRNGLKPDAYGSFSPPHPGKDQIPHPYERLTSQIPYYPGTENSQMPKLFGA